MTETERAIFPSATAFIAFSLRSRIKNLRFGTLGTTFGRSVRELGAAVPLRR